MWNNILIIGGSGRLGTELKKHLKGNYPDISKFNIIKPPLIPCDLIVHMAAYTNVDKAQTDRFNCMETNVFGTYQLLSLYRDKPFIFISTEHVNAEGVYCQSKLIGELLVSNLAANYLIIRTLFKPNPWPWEYAFTDQITQGDYVDIIAPIIATMISKWDGISKTVYAGTGRKTMIELARRTKPDVKPNSVNDMTLKRAKDYL